MINWDQLAAWCTTQVAQFDLPTVFVVGPETKKNLFPDSSGFVTPTPGAPAEAEGVIRLPGFQVRFRTPSEYLGTTMAQADLLDNALIFGDWGVNIWGTRILSIDHTGGGPYPLPEDEPHDRVSVVCTYIAREAIQPVRGIVS